MPRPQRIEYENAFYHIMNRGRGQQMIFHGEKFHQAFLETLNEVHTRFGCIIHAYCLMGNHYHLLLETPNANLSRIMRHINGVYTQRYNRLKKTDGSLFRGRFKAILVDKDEYIMQLSRYIHRNPIDMKRPLVSDLVDYPWSSYPAYINKSKTPNWLYREFTYEILVHKNKYRAYKHFVDNEIDDEIKKLYGKKNLPSIIGAKPFKKWVYEKVLINEESEEKIRIIKQNVPMEKIVNQVSIYYNLDSKLITQRAAGRKSELVPRKIAMYLCQELSGKYLREIAQYFNLKQIGSVSYHTSMIRKKRRNFKSFGRNIDKLLDLINENVT